MQSFKNQSSNVFADLGLMNSRPGVQETQTMKSMIT